ncbi:MAG TPA: sulfite exporter TauE/SafE family protein [Gaiellaceae bacterium]
MRRVTLVLAAFAALAAPAAAVAHPLGNFTVNRFSRVEVAAHRVYVVYVLDLAEIPTYQAGRIDRAAYARRLAAGASLELDGERVRLTPVAVALAHPRGAGGLRTTRLEVLLRGPRVDGPTPFRYRDANYASRIGWKEIVVGARTRSESDELRAYPKSLLESLLDVTAASGTLQPRGGTLPRLTSGAVLAAPDRVADAGFASLVGHESLSPLVVLASLGAALFWGMAHALSPGHGKTIITAYLVGRRGTPWDAALLGLIVTVTHTIGVFALGLVTLALSELIVPDTLYPWLNLATGILVVGIGASVFWARFPHRREHAQGHPHHHHHAPGRGSLLAVGVSGGLLPCPSALVVLLAAISLHRIPFGMLLIVAFSAGLALSITGVGLVAVLARRVFARLSFDGPLVRLLPAASALVILAAGLAMTLRALPKVS